MQTRNRKAIVDMELVVARTLLCAAVIVVVSLMVKYGW